MKFMIYFRIGDFIFVFGHISQLKEAFYRTLVREEKRN